MKFILKKRLPLLLKILVSFAFGVILFLIIARIFGVHAPTEKCYDDYKEVLVQVKNGISEDYLLPENTVVTIKGNTITVENTFSWYSVSSSSDTGFLDLKMYDGKGGRIFTIIIGSIVLGAISYLLIDYIFYRINRGDIYSN